MLNKKSEDIRMIAVDALLRIEKGEFSHLVLKDVLDKHGSLSRKDRAFVKRLVNGTLDYKLQLDYFLGRMIDRGLNKIKPAILIILRTGMYQLFYMDMVPDSAACNEAVKLVEKKKLGALKGFVNGVLRNAARNKEQLLKLDEIKDRAQYLSVRYSVPEWLVKMWLSEYGDECAEKMLNASLNASDISVRVNTHVISVEDCKKRLEAEGMDFELHPYISEAFILKKPDNISALTSFKDGAYQIQDISSMLVCMIGGIKEGDNVLDICAAPGGKATHAAVLAGNGHVMANDISEQKIRLIDENAKRLKLNNINTRVGDAVNFISEFENKFDVVIADLPCSGLGIIGRKSDIKYRINRDEIKKLADLQKQILKNAVRYVKCGGRLIFSTCTVNHMENNDNLKWLIDNFGLKPVDFMGLLCDELKKEDSAGSGFLQLKQGVHKCDGFFAAVLEKTV